MIWLITLICFQTITSVSAVDTTPPVVVSCPDPIEKNAPAGQYKIQVEWIEPQAKDDSAITTLSTYRPGRYFYVGTTQVIYWFIDGNFNVAKCQFTVTVYSEVYPYYDITPPSLECPVEKRAFVRPGVQSTAVTFDISYSDDSGGDVAAHIYPPSGSRFLIGTTNVWVFATDKTGNTAYCTFKVIVSESNDICDPNPCPGGKECYRNSKNTVYKCDNLPIDGCSYPGQIANGYIIPNTGETYAFGSKVTFVCMPGFMLEGATDSICSNEKTWSSDLPKCVNEGDNSAQGGSCNTPYGTGDLLGAIFGSIVILLIIETIVFAILYRRRRLRAAENTLESKKKTKPSRPPPPSHRYTTNHQISPSAPTVTTLSSKPPSEDPAYQGLDPKSRESEHNYMGIGNGRRARSMPNPHTTDNEFDNDAYEAPAPDYIEVLP